MDPTTATMSETTERSSVPRRSTLLLAGVWVLATLLLGLLAGQVTALALALWTRPITTAGGPLDPEKIADSFDLPFIAFWFALYLCAVAAGPALVVLWTYGRLTLQWARLERSWTTVLAGCVVLAAVGASGRGGP